MGDLRDDEELLRLGEEAAYLLDTRGRIVVENAPDRSAGPRMRLAGCATANRLLLRHDVDDDIAAAIEDLAHSEPMLATDDTDPVHVERYVDLLNRQTAVERFGAGVSWTYPAGLVYEHSAELVLSGTREGDDLLARIEGEGMPAEMKSMGFRAPDDLWRPWCIALDGREIASIAFASRLSPVGAATGLNTIPSARGRGFGAAATAGWARHPELRGLPLFYGHDRTNRSSRRVTERLGLRFLGATFSIT